MQTQKEGSPGPPSIFPAPRLLLAIVSHRTLAGRWGRPGPQPHAMCHRVPRICRDHLCDTLSLMSPGGLGTSGPWSCAGEPGVGRGQRHTRLWVPCPQIIPDCDIWPSHQGESLRGRNRQEVGTPECSKESFPIMGWMRLHPQELTHRKPGEAGRCWSPASGNWVPGGATFRGGSCRFLDPRQFPQGKLFQAQQPWP